jgi:DNA-binding response OmpR family regulator
MSDGQATCKILIVVDEPDLAATCSRFLRRMGHAPRVATRPDEVETLIAGQWPDLILADARLPGAIGGLSLLRAAPPGGRRPPVVLCTDRPVELPQDQAVRAGAAGYLVKPFTLAELRDAVERVLAEADRSNRLRPA